MSRRPLASTTVREALDSAVIAIAAAGSDTPRLDAEVLLAAALGIDRTALFLDPSREVSGAAVNSSSWPWSTSSRLCTSRLTRWSFTRRSA